MRKTTLLLMAFITLASYKSIGQQKALTLTIREKADLIRYLKETETGVLNSVKGLTAAQLNFKPAEDKWSVEECIKHIAAAETELWAMVDPVLKQPVNPDKRAEIKFTDAELIKAVEDRSHKSKTFAALEPKNSPYSTLEQALNAFKKSREKLVTYIKSNPKDLRNHVLALPLGTYDAYQFILLISAHSKRHTAQIEELKNSNNFPNQ